MGRRWGVEGCASSLPFAHNQVQRSARRSPVLQNMLHMRHLSFSLRPQGAATSCDKPRQAARDHPKKLCGITLELFECCRAGCHGLLWLLRARRKFSEGACVAFFVRHIAETSLPRRYLGSLLDSCWRSLRPAVQPFAAFRHMQLRM